MKKYLKDYAVLFLIAGSIVLLDQWTKYLVRTNVPFGLVFKPEWWISQYIRIVHWSNTGAAFGLFQDLSMVFTVLAFVVAAVIIYYYPRVPREEWLIRLAMAMQMGGALGNLVDRLTRGHVTDFFSVLNFPVFNVADASISIGVVILFFALWQNERKEKALLAAAAQDEEGDISTSDLSSQSLREETQAD